MGSHSAWNRTNAKFSLGSLSYQSRQLQLRFAFLGHMLPIFVEGDGARMRGTG
jgi:hypothetical protein